MIDVDQFTDVYDLADDVTLSQLKEYHQDCITRLETLKNEIAVKTDSDLFDKIALKVRTEIKDRAWSQVRAIERGEKIQLKHWALSAR